MRKIVIFILSTLLLLNNFMTFAAEGIFTDVLETDSNHTAIKTLHDENILLGYEDGTFGLFKEVTRAEFAIIMCKVLKIDDLTEGSDFSDVSTEHWANKHIYALTSRNIISGYPDGTFKPESPVKFEEAVKMIVASSGKAEVAEEIEAYPAGYLIVASQEGITKNAVQKTYTTIDEEENEVELTVSCGVVGTNLPRWSMAQLICNAFFGD